MWLRDSPLQRKITAVALITALTTIVFSVAALSFLQLYEYKRVFTNQIKTTAGMAASGLTGALEFNDQQTADQTLSILRAEPRILEAALYDREAKSFAVYSRDGRATFGSKGSLVDGESFEGSYLVTNKSVEHNGRLIGALTIKASTSEIFSKTLKYSIVAVVISLLSAVTALILLRHLRLSVSRPITQLASKAAEISESGNMSLRAIKESGDETGLLVDQFNHMLSQLESKTRELQENKRSLQLITDSVPVLIAHLSPQLVYTFANKAYETVLGKKASDLVGRKLRDVIGAETMERALPHLRLALSGMPTSYEIEVVGKNSVVHSMLVNYVTHTEEGGIKGLFAVLIDISERKAAEAERELLLLRERKARAESETANRVKDEFLATLSHELRTPLNAIVGWATILSNGKIDATVAKEGVEIILKSARTQAKLINDLLDLSRIATGKIELGRNVVDLVEVVDRAVDTVTLMANEKSISLEVLHDNAKLMVIGDEGRLEQVVNNILTNAIKFSPNNATVIIKSARLSPDRVALEIADTGIGLEPAFLPFIFDKFRQGDSSSTRIHGGLGIGLSLVKKLVTAHG